MFIPCVAKGFVSGLGSGFEALFFRKKKIFHFKKKGNV